MLDDTKESIGVNSKYRCHIFYSQRVIDVHDGKPKWSGLNDKSELINEVERGDTNTVLGEPTNENKQE